MKYMVIMMGVPGSGKSTFYQRFLQRDFVRVDPDILHTRHREDLLIEACISIGRSFAVDNTNPQRTDRARYIPAAKAAGYRVIGCYMDTHIVDCMARSRTGQIRHPAASIASLSRKLEVPTLSEGFDELYFVNNTGREMRVERALA